ncbi:glycine-rich domain-containing protein [Streptomyces antibioticus]|uniref:glycine-rich domain-containing protein n=1 Tax=Streptomyces antibioticus TaxID=1890 RepID=UPI002258C559|nr:hypothetical protein [Streptomyces antibioticus]MCX4742797.1 hypothetical protein [Streptomyces antibioticus]
MGTPTNTATIEAQAGFVPTNKHLIDDQLWERLVNRIVKDEDMEHSLAERIMDQALGFLAVCATDKKADFRPSPLVDIGWHTFILYTKPYADFCERVAGWFIHHEPSDVPGVEYPKGDTASAIAAMKAHGLVIDEPLWANTGHCEAGCCCNT